MACPQVGADGGLWTAVVVGGEFWTPVVLLVTSGC